MICPACNCKYEESLTFCPKDGTALVPDDSQVESREGQILADRYRIVRMLGEGGMGEVYEAEHIYIKKKVALKLLRNEITSNAEAVTRFHQEALAASTIGHDNIVVIDDFGRLPDGSVYLTMEYLAGEPLSDLMLRGRMAPDRALEIIIQICRGLAAAHSKGIIHRDMKPENVYLVVAKDGTDLCKILDFGIAKVSSADSGENLTRTGTIFGTPHYMSPEQAMGRKLDHRTDIYSVGVIMYELFTGVVPFKAESFMGILTQHITALPQPPRECAPDRQIHPEIERIILTSMNKEPEKRYPSMVEFLEDLQNCKRTVTSLQQAVGGPAATAPGASGGWGVSQSSFHPAQPGSPPKTVAASAATPLPSSMPTMPAAMTPAGGLPSASVGMPSPSASMPSAPAAHVTPGPMTAPVVYQSSGGGSGKTIAIIVAILVLLGGGGAAAFFALSGKDKKGGDEGGEKTAKAAMDPGEMSADAMDAMDAADAMKDDGMGSGLPTPDGMEPMDAMKPPEAMDAVKPPDAMDAMTAMAPDAMALPPVKIRLKTRPRSAKVYANGERVCVTPCSVTVPAGGELQVTLKREDHEDKTITVKAGGPKSLSVKLSKVPAMRPVQMRPVMRRVPPMWRPVMRRPPMRRPPMHRVMRRMSANPFGEGID